MRRTGERGDNRQAGTALKGSTLAATERCRVVLSSGLGWSWRQLCFCSARPPPTPCFLWGHTPMAIPFSFVTLLASGHSISFHRACVRIVATVVNTTAGSRDESAPAFRFLQPFWYHFVEHGKREWGGSVSSSRRGLFPDNYLELFFSLPFPALCVFAALRVDAM